MGIVRCFIAIMGNCFQIFEFLVNFVFLGVGTKFLFELSSSDLSFAENVDSSIWTLKTQRNFKCLVFVRSGFCRLLFFLPWGGGGRARADGLDLHPS